MNICEYLFYSESCGEDEKPKPVTAAQRQREREEKRRKKQEKRIKKMQDRKPVGKSFLSHKKKM